MIAKATACHAPARMGGNHASTLPDTTRRGKPKPPHAQSSALVKPFLCHADFFCVFGSSLLTRFFSTMQRTHRQRITKTTMPTAVRQIFNAIMVVIHFIQACCNYFAKRGKCQKSLTYWTVFDTPRLTPRAHWCKATGMATATYDSKHARWDLSWKKPAANGKYAYGRKRISDKTYPTLGAREQKKMQKEQILTM